MKTIIKYPLAASNEFVLVEVETDDIVPAEGIGLAGNAREKIIIKQASHTFEKALDTVLPIVVAIASKLQAIASSTDEVNVEFGIKMSADAGAILISAGVEANFKVSLKWKKG